MRRWFGVKTVYRTWTVGKPRVVDSDYDNEGTLVEERVVLVRARDHDAAIKRAEWEAAKYAKNSHTNPYGQLVVTRRLKAIETFELARFAILRTREVAAQHHDAAGNRPLPVTLDSFLPSRQFDRQLR